MILPFSWQGLRLHAVGATELRVRLSRGGPYEVSVEISDGAGQPVASIESLVLRPAPNGGIAGIGPDTRDSLFQVEWSRVKTESTGVLPSAATLGGQSVISEYVTASEWIGHFSDLESLLAHMEAGSNSPRFRFVECSEELDGTITAGARHGTAFVLGLLQAWLADSRLNASHW